MRKNSVFNNENSYLNSWYNITKGFEEFYKNESHDLNVNPAESMFLSIIYYNDGISQREIAKRLFVSEANITKTFKKLAEKELVYKTIDEKNNARRNLHLTEKGEETFEKCIRIFYDFDEILFERFTAEEREEMEAQLKAIGDRSLSIVKK